GEGVASPVPGRITTRGGGIVNDIRRYTGEVEVSSLHQLSRCGGVDLGHFLLVQSLIPDEEERLVLNDRSGDVSVRLHEKHGHTVRTSRGRLAGLEFVIEQPM